MTDDPDAETAEPANALVSFLARELCQYSLAILKNVWRTNRRGENKRVEVLLFCFSPNDSSDKNWHAGQNLELWAEGDDAVVVRFHSHHAALLGRYFFADVERGSNFVQVRIMVPAEATS